jgi:hypothetical protein
MTHEQVYKKDVVIINRQVKGSVTVVGKPAFASVKESIVSGKNVFAFHDIFLAKFHQGEVIKNKVC